MGKSYKEKTAEYKQLKHDPEAYSRVVPRAKKFKPYKLIGRFGVDWLDTGPFVIRRYATIKDAQKGLEAAKKANIYYDLVIEEPNDQFRQNH